MGNIKISTREEAGVSVEAVYSLFREAFRQWTDHGLNARSLLLTLEEFNTIAHNGIVLVAVDTETCELLGTRILLPRKKYIYECLLSVSPKVKHRGIATRILQYEEKLVRKAGYDYLLCRTAVNAFWSVNWHRKMGYRIIGYKRSPGRNYATYVYRKQLTPSLFWSGPLAPVTAYLHFLMSYTITRLCKTSTGEFSSFGQVARVIVRTIKKFSFH